MWPLEEIVRRNQERANRAEAGLPEVKPACINAEGCQRQDCGTSCKLAEELSSGPGVDDLAGQIRPEEYATAKNAEQAEWDAKQTPRITKRLTASLPVLNPSSPWIKRGIDILRIRYPDATARLYAILIEVDAFGQQSAEYRFVVTVSFSDTFPDTKEGAIRAVSNTVDALSDLGVLFGLSSFDLSIDGEIGRFVVRR